LFKEHYLNTCKFNKKDLFDKFLLLLKHKDLYIYIEKEVCTEDGNKKNKNNNNTESQNSKKIVDILKYIRHLNDIFCCEDNKLNNKNNCDNRVINSLLLYDMVVEFIKEIFQNINFDEEKYNKLFDDPNFSKDLEKIKKKLCIFNKTSYIDNKSTLFFVDKADKVGKVGNNDIMGRNCLSVQKGMTRSYSISQSICSRSNY
jgi:hypothetical protein